ncbi:tetratricopeptide repeat protein [Nannocystis pusilla]|uniref:Tetratricopeptide repeat protein n=1 Tax=Nannocystis pusilla TaxID=889268 RepID=A0ABS7TJY3_9BACT|nr:hypothetical protein [Nannocystis pusilla]MBZ5708540.1 hypothetical protein [Nannocystis pusilla]
MPGTRSALASTLGCLTLVAALGCARYVVRVETDPAGAEVTVDGNTSREQRWSVSGNDEPTALLARWPDGKQVAAQVYIDRDSTIVMRRDGEADQVVGARVVGMAPGLPPGPPPVAEPGAAPPLTGPLPPPPSTITPGPGDPMAKARKLYDEGQKAYELTDFDVAIEKFRAAYELIRSSNDPAAPEVLGAVIFNLAVVYERSYEVTPDLERLRRARVMYRQYDEQMASIQANWAKSSEHADVLARIRALEARLEPKQ